MSARFPRARWLELALLVPAPAPAQASEHLTALRSVRPYANGYVLESTTGQRLLVRAYRSRRRRWQWVGP